MDISEKNKRIPFPQANDFNKIIKIVLIDNPDNLSNKSLLMKLLDLGTERQVSYYMSACEFLDIIDSNGSLTDFAKLIREKCFETQILMLANKIISKPVFGEVFLMRYYNCIDFQTEEISQLISDIYNIKNSDVCNRRASTVKSWIKWIEEQKAIFI